MPTAPFAMWSGDKLDPAVNNGDAYEQPVMLKASTTYKRGQVLGEMVGTDEVNTITVNATGGVWKFIYNAITSGNIAQGLAPDDVRPIVEAMSSVGFGNVRVDGPTGGPYVFTFINALGSQNTSAVTTDATGLTGGAGTAVVVNTTPGVAGSPGTWAIYASGNTDGSQNPNAILRRACVTDAAGNITYGGAGVVAGGGEQPGQVYKYTDAFFQGAFFTDDLVGLDAAAVAKLGRLRNGTVAHGLLLMTGT